MPTAARAPTTAAELFDAIEPCGLSVEGGKLTLARPAPAALRRPILVLHTGVRAMLVGRPWYGCGSTTRTAAPAQLVVGTPIPLGITLLCVEGDESWHRIPPTARELCPDLFEPEPTPPEPKAKKKAAPTLVD